MYVIINTMEKELDFFKIDGIYYGGDQNWHTHPLMKLGGCSAVCACEQCITAARNFPALSGLYPYNPLYVTKTDFLKFFEQMFAYIHPGIGGLTSIDKLERMFLKYAHSAGVSLSFEKLNGHAEYESAAEFVKGAIDDEVPVMYLMLKHADIAFDEYEWHWFNLTGYQIKAGNMNVSFATWGKRHDFDFAKAWNTGKFWRGGMLRIAKQCLK